jgi:hypothetical protein
MNDVCQLLKETRLGKGLSIDEVAQRTYIKLHYLEALEEGQLDKLPAMVHTYGYIRQYAKLLGLDGGQLVAQFQQHEQRASAAPKAARTPTSELFNETLNFLKPIKSSYGNGNGYANGNGHGNGHYAAAPTLEPPAAAPASPELPSPQAPAAYAPPPATYAPPPAPYAPAPAAYAPPVAPPATSPSFFRPAGRDAAGPAATPPEVEDARAQAQQILLAAEREARELVRGAEGYADEVLGQLEAEVSATLTTIQNGRQFLAARRRSGPPALE